MKKQKRIYTGTGALLILLFIIWTFLVQSVDVRIVEVTGTQVGFAKLNFWFHRLTGVHLWLYIVTDWLSLIPFLICLIFGGIGFFQLVKRKSLLKVDFDIMFLGIYYAAIIFFYLFFEEIPINYRPIKINGIREVSYPSSTTLLVLGVMHSLNFQINKRWKKTRIGKWIIFLSAFFSLFMVTGRLFSGVHWVTDIIGSILLSTGIFYLYKAAVLLYGKEDGC